MNTEHDRNELSFTVTNNTPENSNTTTSPSSRMRAFDLARGVAIVAMVLIHSIVFLGDPALTKTIPGYIANSIICLFAAPVFTFIMGVMISFSSKSTIKTLLWRGCIILCVGYLLNFLRGTLPIAFAEWAEWVDYQDERPWAYMLEQDILQFAGIAFMLIALFKRLIRSNIGLAVLGGVIVAAAPLLYKIQLGEGVPGYLVSLLFGGNHFNFFPIVPWIAFPLIGMGYGELLKKSVDKNNFMRKSALVGLLLLVAGGAVIIGLEKDVIVQWYSGKFRQGKLPPVVSLIFLGFQFAWIPLCYLITGNIKKSRILDLLYHWSANVTWFYAIQWVIIGWACVLLPLLTWMQVMIAVVLITVVTDRAMLSFVNNKGRVKA